MIHKKKIHALLFLIIFFIGILQIFVPVRQSKKSPSMEHILQKKINRFFYDLFSRSLGYTLIGAKPISIEEISTGCFGEEHIEEECFAALRDTFAESKKYILKIYSTGTLRHIELINKPAVLDLINTNVFLHRYVKKNFLSTENFWGKISDQSLGIHTILHKDARPIGYLLGYDKTNIAYYLRRIEVGRYLQKYPYVRYNPIPGGRYPGNSCIPFSLSQPYKKVCPQFGFSSLEEEWQFLQRVSWEIEKETDPIPPFFVFLPVYICRHGGTSEATYEKFIRARGRVAELFCNKPVQQAIFEIAHKDTF